MAHGIKMGMIVRRLVRNSFTYLCQISICAKPADFCRMITDAQGVGFQCRDLDFVPTTIGVQQFTPAHRLSAAPSHRSPAQVI